MLYANALTVQEVEDESSQVQATINTTQMFDNLDLKTIAVRDNGVIKVEGGAVVNKKFKYFNNLAGGILNIEAYSSTPSVICIKTP